MNPTGLSALVVEDDPVSRLVLCRMLDALGFAVAAAEDLAPALRQIADGCFAVVLADFELPSGTGLDLLRQVRRLGAAPPFILVTGIAANTVPIADAAICDQLVKPVTTRALTRGLSNAIAAWSA